MMLSNDLQTAKETLGGQWVEATLSWEGTFKHVPKKRPLPICAGPCYAALSDHHLRARFGRSPLAALLVQS
jgi:hypothetical protein